MKDRYAKLRKAILMQETKDTAVDYIFLEDWVAYFGIPSKLLTDNGSQFASRILVAVCSTLAVNSNTTTE